MEVNYLALYAITTGLFVMFDAFWLGLAAKNLYANELKDLMAKNVKWGAAVLFYAIFIAGLIYFVIAPSLKSGSSHNVLLAGAFFGFVCYATYDLTNYSTLKGFPLKIVIIDMLWGTAVSSIVSILAYTVYTKLI